MTQAIGYWLMSTVITAFIVTFDPDFNVKEKVKIVAGFSVFITLLMNAVILMLGGWK